MIYNIGLVGARESATKALSTNWGIRIPNSTGRLVMLIDRTTVAAETERAWSRIIANGMSREGRRP